METDELIRDLRERKDNLETTMEGMKTQERELEAQERELRVRFARIEGQLYEIVFALEKLEVENEVR